MNTIRKGSVGPDVATWQGIIGVVVDGSFGPATEVATKAWQTARGLVADGVVGPASWGAAGYWGDASDEVALVQARNFTPRSRRAQDITTFVIHTPETPEHGTAAESVARFFADQPRHGAIDAKWCAHDKKTGELIPWSGASCHYTVDVNSIVQSVRDKDEAWHATATNGYSIGFELAGKAAQTADEWADAYSLTMLDRAARFIARKIRDEYPHIPVRRLSVDEVRARKPGFCGHSDVNAAFHGGAGHTDPGRFFPWTWFLDRVRAHLAELEEPSPPTLREPIVLTPHVAFDGASTLSENRLVPVEYDGATWLVFPIYVAPVAIGAAAEIVERMGCELPSPGLVDAIWRAADLRVPPHLMIRSHDGTAAGMNAPELHERQQGLLEAFIGTRSLGRDFRLLAGAYKDVVRDPVTGKLALYGWHVEAAELAKMPVPTHAPATPGPGRVVQPVFTGHAPSWVDYSQGVRPVRRAS